MTIAMLGVRLDLTSRSVCIGRTLRLIDAAARSEPAPELIVLPFGCEGMGNDGDRLSNAPAETYQGGLSARARDWGLYIVFGQCLPVQTGCRDAVMVVDADGDVVVSLRGDDDSPLVSRCEAASGTLSVGMESRVLTHPAADCADWPLVDALIIIGGPREGRATGRQLTKSLADYARKMEAAVFLVRPIWCAESPDSVAFSDAGLVTGRSDLAEGLIVTAEIPSGAWE